MLELNRILRPGGFFVWSATPVYRDDERDQNVWKGVCFELLFSPPRNSVLYNRIVVDPLSFLFLFFFEKLVDPFINVDHFHYFRV